MSKSRNYLPFSEVYKRKMKEKNKKINKALSRREKLLRNYYKKYVLEQKATKKKSKTLEKDSE